MSKNDVGKIDRVLQADTGIFNLSFSLLLLAFVLWIALTSLSYSTSASLFPLLVSTVTLVLLTLAVLNSAEKLTGKSLIPERLQFGQNASTESTSEELIQKRRSTASILSWIFGVIVLIYLIGMDIALFVFLLSYYRYHTGLGWVRTAAITVGLWLSLIGIFAFILGVPFPEGIAVGWLFDQLAN